MIENSWIILVVFLVMCLEIVFFWWLFACDGWCGLQRFGDSLRYEPRHTREFWNKIPYRSHVNCRCEVNPYKLESFEERMNEVSEIFRGRKDGIIKVWR